MTALHAIDTKTRTYTCLVCGDEFDTEHELDEHIRESHPAMVDMTPSHDASEPERIVGMTGQLE